MCRSTEWTIFEIMFISSSPEESRKETLWEKRVRDAKTLFVHKCEQKSPHTKSKDKKTQKKKLENAT